MRCWSCHKVEMKEVEDKAGHPFRKCPGCGATDTDLPERLNPPAFTLERDSAVGGWKRRPHPVSKRKAKK